MNSLVSAVLVPTIGEPSITVTVRDWSGISVIIDKQAFTLVKLADNDDVNSFASKYAQQEIRGSVIFVAVNGGKSESISLKEFRWLTERPSLLLKVERSSSSPECYILEKQGFFDSLSKLYLGPLGRVEMLDISAADGYPKFFCSFLDDSLVWSTFDTSRAITLLNIQDFCDTFLSQHEERPLLSLAPAVTAIGGGGGSLQDQKPSIGGIRGPKGPAGTPGISRPIVNSSDPLGSLDRQISEGEVTSDRIREMEKMILDLTVRVVNLEKLVNK